MPGQLDGLAAEWLVRLNLEHTPTNLRLARNQVVLGKLLGKGGATLAIVTTNRHMRFLRALLDWGFARMTHPPKIDWKSFIQGDRDAKVARDQREAFTVDELRTFFAGPIWSGAKSQVRRFDPGPLIIHDAGYFGPPGLIYTGMRREEWFGLRTGDVVLVDGMWVFRLAADRQLKNANAVRDVPVADELIRLQLLDYVELRRSRGDAYLFPTSARQLPIMASNMPASSGVGTCAPARFPPIE